MKIRNWNSYWSRQDAPLHASDSQAFYGGLAKEILFYTGQLSNKRVLELGCGDGALFEYLDIDIENYTGVDFSGSLLRKFRGRYEEINLQSNDIMTYMRECDDNHNVILSYGVLQYLTRSELSELFYLQKRCLGKGGMCVHFGVPVKELRSVFFKGIGSTEAVKRNRSRGMIKQIKSRLLGKIGHWHSIPDLYKLSCSHGYQTNIPSNMSYYYRVNLIQCT